MIRDLQPEIELCLAFLSYFCVLTQESIRTLDHYNGLSSDNNIISYMNSIIAFTLFHGDLR